MSRISPSIDLNDKERTTLQSLVRSGKTGQQTAFRAKIILAASEGQENQKIAATLTTTEQTVGKWRSRFVDQRLDGLRDTPRPGIAPKYDEDTDKRVLLMLDQAVPKGFSIWSGPLIAKELGDVSEHKVWRILRKYGICLSRRHSWCISNDPEFEEKATAIIGLYLAPPENAIVLSVDEKPAIQALERDQGYLKLPNGKAITGYNHEYKRHGTTNLFAALEVHTGKVKTANSKRRRRREFLAFMNSVIKDYPDREIHVVLDNLRTHKPKHDRWLPQHKNVHFYYTPTHASWLNQVEIWFSILWKKALRGGSFTAVYYVRKLINEFVEVYNETSVPFKWKAEKVYPCKPKNNYNDLCK